jgi:hypothetical protein
MTITTTTASELTIGTTIRRDGQTYVVTAIGENAFEQLLVEVECVDGNVGQVATWTFPDPTEQVTVHA